MGVFSDNSLGFKSSNHIWFYHHFFCHLLRYKKENILIMANNFSRNYNQNENFDGITLHHVDAWIRKKSLYMDDIWISISQLGRFGLAC